MILKSYATPPKVFYPYLNKNLEVKTKWSRRLKNSEQN